MPRIKRTPKEVQDGLIDGEEYWLGTCWGIYYKDTSTFTLGNCFVPKHQTIFKNIKSK